MPLRYVDLTGGIKPYLLTGVGNNSERPRGSRTRRRPVLPRGPAGRHAVGDPAAVPGARRERVESTRRQPHQLVCTYSYHHGFFDGVEREFRGFARVDQLDTDSVPSRRAPARSPQHRPERRRLQASAGPDQDLVPHRCLPRRHDIAAGSPPNTTSATPGRRTWRPPCCPTGRARGAARGLPRAAGAGAAHEVFADDGTPERPTRTPPPSIATKSPAPAHARPVTFAAAAPTPAPLRGVLPSRARVDHLPLRTQPRRPAHEPRAYPRGRPLRHRDQ